MFSSNQIFKISGALTQESVAKALEFALKLSDDYRSFNRADEPTKCVYQITKDGRYCIGWSPYSGPTKEGWCDFPFDFDINIMAAIIVKHLSKQEIDYSHGMWDGSYDKGFVIEAIEDYMSDEHDGIINPFYGIVQFKPFTCFYAK